MTVVNLESPHISSIKKSLSERINSESDFFKVKEIHIRKKSRIKDSTDALITLFLGGILTGICIMLAVR